MIIFVSAVDLAPNGARTSAGSVNDLHIEADTKWATFRRRHFQTYFYGYVRHLITISLKFIPNGQFNNIPALIQVIAWHQKAFIWNNDG